MNLSSVIMGDLVIFASPRQGLGVRVVVCVYVSVHSVILYEAIISLVSLLHTLALFVLYRGKQRGRSADIYFATH